MMQFDVKVDASRAKRLLGGLQKSGIARATSRAINDVLVTVRAVGAREIKNTHPAMKIGEIKSNIATYKATPTKLTGALETRGRPLSLLLFQARQTKAGVTARIGRGKRGLVVYRGRHAFIVNAYGGEVFVRREAKGRSIRRFRGPSMPGVFRAQAPLMKRTAKERFLIRFPHQMAYEISAAGGKPKVPVMEFGALAAVV